MAARTVPRKVDDGGWWIVPAFVKRTCQSCSKTDFERPAIMRYLEDLDDDGLEAEENPAWARDGYLVWWHCQRCEYDWSTDTATYQEIWKWMEPLQWEEL